MSEQRYEREAKRWHSYAPLIAAFLFSLGALVYLAINGPLGPWSSDAPHQFRMEHQLRLDAIAGAWDVEPRMRSGACPEVDALEQALPELRGIDARERDYVGLLKGIRC